MNIRDFEYLIAVDELKNFSKAANKCFISQPALSQQIKKIEDQLQCKIFERDKKQIITTKLGLEIIQHAKNITSSFAAIKTINNQEHKLKIALIPTICPYLLPHIVDKLHHALPNIKFYFLELKTGDLMQKLKLGEIDIGIIAYFDNLIDNKTQYQKLYSEEFLLALPKNSKSTESDFPDIIANHELILLEEGNCMSDNIRDICTIYNNTSFSNFFATNIETVKNMIRINNGAGLLPKLSCLNQNDLKLISFKSKKTREIGMISRNSYNDNSIVQSIGKIISSTIKNL